MPRFLFSMRCSSGYFPTGRNFDNGFESCRVLGSDSPPGRGSANSNKTICQQLHDLNTIRKSNPNLRIFRHAQNPRHCRLTLLESRGVERDRRCIYGRPLPRKAKPVRIDCFDSCFATSPHPRTKNHGSNCRSGD